MELTVDITTDGHRASLFTGVVNPGVFIIAILSVKDVPQAVRLIPLGVSLEPKPPSSALLAHCSSPPHLRRIAPPSSPTGWTAAIASKRGCRTFSHNLWTSTSLSCLHCMRVAIHPSSSFIDDGSATAMLEMGSDRPTSSIFVSIFGRVVRSGVYRRGEGPVSREQLVVCWCGESLVRSRGVC